MFFHSCNSKLHFQDHMASMDDEHCNVDRLCNQECVCCYLSSVDKVVHLKRELQDFFIDFFYVSFAHLGI